LSREQGSSCRIGRKPIVPIRLGRSAQLLASYAAFVCVLGLARINLLRGHCAVGGLILEWFVRPSNLRHDLQGSRFKVQGSEVGRIDLCIGSGFAFRFKVRRSVPTLSASLLTPSRTLGARRRTGLPFTDIQECVLVRCSPLWLPKGAPHSRFDHGPRTGRKK